MALEIIVTGANGRMGQCICRIVSADPECRLAGVVERKEHLKLLARYDCPVGENLGKILKQAPQALIIDFTMPEVSMDNARLAAEGGRPIVVGTTGFTDAQKAELGQLAKKTAIFWSANMSIGINAIINILPRLAGLLGAEYDMEIVEIHHRKKKDSPSGTGLMLGEALAKARGWSLAETRRSCRDGIIGERQEDEIGIQAVRGGDVVGVHTIYFLGPGERIELTHQAHSRDNFAEGAISAAKWLCSKKPGRLYNMQDMLEAHLDKM